VCAVRVQGVKMEMMARHPKEGGEEENARHTHEHYLS
jgi:hypothetical protein